MSNILPYVRGETELDQRRAMPVVIVDASGGFIDPAGKRSYPLATNGALANAANVRGGTYIWSAESPNWNGATATLQYLGLDGVTWRNMRNAGNTADLTFTANGSVGNVIVGQGTTLRVLLSGGVPTAFYSSLSGY